jgi:cellulose synthase (UDP-forming)
MFQIFLLKNPIFKKGLSTAQKICYFSNMTYWFFPIFRLPFLVSPLLFIFFNMQIYVANMQEFIAYTVLYMIGNMMMQNYLYGAVRWALVSEVYEYMQTLYLSRGLLSVILNPRKPTFNVTDKGHSLDSDHLSELSTPFFVLFATFSISMATCVWRWFTEPDANELLAVVAMWNFFNLMLSGAALGVVSERRTHRAAVNRPAFLATGAALVPATVLDASYGGCQISLPADALGQPLAVGAPAVIDVTLTRADVPAQSVPVIVAHCRNEGGTMRIGFRFAQLKRRHYQAVADLMYGDAAEIQNFRVGRRGQRGIWHGVSTFVRWGVTEPGRGLTLLALRLRDWRAERRAAARAPASPAIEAPTPLGAMFLGGAEEAPAKSVGQST